MDALHRDQMRPQILRKECFSLVTFVCPFPHNRIPSAAHGTTILTCHAIYRAQGLEAARDARRIVLPRSTQPQPCVCQWECDCRCSACQCLHECAYASVSPSVRQCVSVRMYVVYNLRGRAGAFECACLCQCLRGCFPGCVCVRVRPSTEYSSMVTRLICVIETSSF
jgi:hypothetical protein